MSDRMKGPGSYSWDVRDTAKTSPLSQDAPREKESSEKRAQRTLNLIRHGGVWP